MPLRYLFGPVTGNFASRNLHPQHEQGACLTFGPDDSADLLVRAGDAWSDVRQRLPEGWSPDFLVACPAFGSVPRCIWDAPLPRVGLALDWHLLWHLYRARLRQCDLVLTDSLGVEVLAREGIDARQGNLFGCESVFADEATPIEASSGGRDIDVLFVGNLNPIIQRERAPWLGRLAKLKRRWRVCIRSAVPPDEYRRLLRRARIVFQFSGRGKAGRRAIEAANCGALVFQEPGNRELPGLFRDRQECVYWDAEDLEALIERYLEHEDERVMVAEAARMRARTSRFTDFWQQEIEAIERDWPELRDRSGRPRFVDPLQTFATRCWQALVGGSFDDVALVGDLDRALRDAPDSALLANMTGCMLWRQGRGRAPAKALGDVASDCFRKALVAQPGFALAGLNLAESLDAAGHRPDAIHAATQTLESLQRDLELDSCSTEGFPLCQGFDAFHVGWEQAAWKNAGKPLAEAQAKRDLILWKLHGLLASWTGELRHSYESVLRQPDSLIARAALGDALARQGHHHAAIEHLRIALAQNPFDRQVAYALFQSLGAIKDTDARERLCDDRRLLSQTAPLTVPIEPWFVQPRPKGNELASLIVHCAGPIDRLHQCIDRLLRYSRPPFELVLVDDGADPVVSAHLDEIRKKCRVARVETVRAENMRYVRRCELAVGKTCGMYVVLMDSATLVTAGWLEALIALSLHEWPSVGFVGPVTNDAPVPQGVTISFEEVDGLDSFAASRRRNRAGQMANVQRLSSFCVLAHRATLDRLGAFDQVFDSPDFAVADLCLRARESGLRLLMAHDVFVHHTKNSLDSANVEQDYHHLREKWGDTHSLAHAPGAEPAPAVVANLTPTLEVAADKIGVSLCMIVKNEESNLPECLRSVQGIFDEINVVDTGSTDNTRDEARRYGARVFEFPWIDSFGAARNESIRHATCKWIMWLDADDRLDAENQDRLRKLFANLGDERDAYAITVRSVLDAERSTFRLLDQVRIFRNLPEIRWDYRIHEQILPSVNRAGGTVRWTDVVVDHVGYQDASLRLRKLPVPAPLMPDVTRSS